MCTQTGGHQIRAEIGIGHAGAHVLAQVLAEVREPTAEYVGTRNKRESQDERIIYTHFSACMAHETSKMKVTGATCCEYAVLLDRPKGGATNRRMHLQVFVLRSDVEDLRRRATPD